MLSYYRALKSCSTSGITSREDRGIVLNFQPCVCSGGAEIGGEFAVSTT